MKNFNFFEKLWEHSRTLRRVGLVLVMCLITMTQAWATNLQSIDFTSWTTENVSAGGTSHDLYFKSATTVTNGTGVVFGGNMSTSANYVAIPLSNVCGFVTVTVTHTSGRPSIGYCLTGYDSAPTSSNLSTAPSSVTSVRLASNGTSTTWTIPASKAYAVCYIGVTGNFDSKTLESITISTPGTLSWATSRFYSTYASSSSTALELITGAEFSSNIGVEVSAVSNGTGCSSTVSSPHDFTGLNSKTKYYRLEPGSSSKIVIANISNVKSIRLYGNGNGSTRTVSTVVTKNSGSGSTFSISDMSMANSSSTVVEYTTGDLTAKVGYDASTYYTYTISFANNCDIWGIYVEAGTSICPSAYSFHYGTNGQSDWTTECFTKVGDHDWYIENFVIPTTSHFYVGWQGGSYGQTQLRQWTDTYSETNNIGNGAMVLRPTLGYVVGNAAGAVGTIRIDDDSDAKNQYVSFIPKGYGITYGGTGHAFSLVAGNTYETELLTLPNCTTTYTMGLETATEGTYVTCYHSKAPEALSAPGNTMLMDGKKYIYLNAGVWRTNAEGRPDDVNEKMAVWDATSVSGEWGNGGNFLTYNKATGLYEGYVSSSTTKILFARINNGRASLGNSWGEGVYNQTDNITLTAVNNEFSITGWGSDKSPYTATAHSHPATGDNGKFRMYNNSSDNNWYVHWIPYYKLSYDGNGGTGSVDAQYRNSELSTSPLTVAANGFTRDDGWRFISWNDNTNGTGTDYDPGDNIDITGDQTLYAKWGRDVYLNLNGKWDTENKYFAVYCWKNGGSGNKWVMMELVDACAGVYKATIPSEYYDRIIFVQKNSSDLETWDNKDYQTADLTFPGSKDQYTLSSKNGGDGGKAQGSWASNYAITTFTISYDKGSTTYTGGNSISGSKSNETKTCNVAFTLPSSAVFTTTGYTQTSWTKSDGGSQTHALGGSYTDNEAATFYPVWTPQEYAITYKDGGDVAFSGTHETGYPTSHTYGTETTLKTASKNGYTFGGWFDNASCTGDEVTSIGAKAKTVAFTLYAKWTCTTPTFIEQPDGATVCKDAESPELSVTASANGGSLSYQWYVNTTNAATVDDDHDIDGATSDSYDAPTGTAGTKYYYCVVTNTTGGCSATSDIAMVTVNKPTDITTQPSSIAKANVGAEQTLSLEAEGASLTYQWYSCDSNGDNEKELDGEDEATLSITPGSVGVTYYYCVVDGSCGSSQTSNVVSITAKNAISPTLTYASTVTYGSTVSPTLSGAGDGEVSYSLNSVTPASSLTIVSSTGVVSGAAAGGTATVTATIEDGTNYWGGSATSETITVATAALPGTASTGTATSVTHNSATLPYTISDVTGVASVTIQVYEGETLRKTYEGQSAVASGSCSATGLSASTTYTYTVTLIGDANHNDKTETSKSTSFTTTAAPTCSGDPSALANEKLYKVEDMASACADDLSASGQYKYGLSSNGKFYVVGTTNDNDGSTGTVEMKTDVSLSNVGGDTDADFTNSAWLKMAGSTSHHSIKFVIPTGGGKLYVYGKGGGSKDGKGNVQIKENSTSIVTEVIAKTSSSACKSSAISVNAGTYYIYSSGESAALYGIYFDKAPELSSSDPANGDTDVPVSGTIVLTFDESIADIDDDKFSLSEGTISAVAVDGTYDTKVNITYSGLPGSTEVTLSVAAGAVTDAAGNTSAALGNITFTTENTGYAITLGDHDNGSVAITDGSSAITEAAEGDEVTIEATGNTGYEFTSWTITKTSDASDVTSSVSLSGQTEEATFKMPAYAVTVNATFTAIDYDITHTAAENGTYTIKVGSADAVSTNTTANYGQTITLAATPSSHYKLQAWNVTGNVSGDEITVTDDEFTMPAEAVTIAPTFGEVYTVSFNTHGGGAIASKEQTTVGGAITMPSAPSKSGYTFVKWMIGGTTVSAGADYTPTANVTAHATWKAECEGDDPVLAIGASEATESDYLGTYSTEGITISSDQSWKGNDDKYGPVIALEASSTGYDNTYLEVLASSYNISKVSFLLTGNGSDKSLQPVVFGWASTASSTADTYRMLDAKTVSNKGYANAEWFTYDFSASEVKRVRIYRASKSVSSTSPSYTGSSTPIGNATTIWVYGIKVWLDDGGSSCYYVTYDGNGADAGYVNDDRVYDEGDDPMVQSNYLGFEREGYEFNGWYTKANYDGSGTAYEPYDFISDINDDITLYAQWKIVVDEDNENLSGFETPQYKDVVVRNGATLTISQDMSVRNITVESGSTLNVATTAGDEGVTLSTTSLSLVGGYYEKPDHSTVYDMPRVYIDPLSTLSRTNSTINFDIAVTNNFHPIAVPFPVKVSDVKYADPAVDDAEYLTHYIIKTYDGAARANGSYSCWTPVYSSELNEETKEYEDVYLQPGRGYILAALRRVGKLYEFIRFPMKNVPSAWTTLGEQGTVDDVTKNVVAVEAYLKDGDADGSKTPNANKGWNILGVPFMSRYQATDDIIQSPTEIIQGHFDYSTNKWDDDEIRYVTVPTYDFSEYNQYSIEDEGTILLPGWCFFVQVETSGNLKFLSASEAENEAMPIYAPKREQERKPTVKTGIILTGANAKDKTTIIVSDKYNAAEYEINADLEKMFGENGYTLATYTLSGETRLAYNAMNNADIMNVIPVGYRAPEEGEYTFSINPRYAESEAFEQVNLIDYQKGVITNLLQSSYSFTTARTQNDARFAINVVKRQDMPTDVENGASGINDANGPRKVLINDKMYILLDGKMYDATGKAVK